MAWGYGLPTVMIDYLLFFSTFSWGLTCMVSLTLWYHD